MTKTILDVLNNNLNGVEFKLGSSPIKRVINGFVGDQDNHNTIVDVIDEFGKHHILPAGEFLSFGWRVVPQTYKISDDKTLVILMEAKAIHEDDVLEYENLQRLVVGVLPNTLYPIITFSRRKNARSIDENRYGVNGNKEIIKKHLRIDLRDKEYGFYDAKLKERRI